MHDERYTIISADMHAGASLAGYKPYLESRWHDEYDAWAEGLKGGPWDAKDDTSTRMRCCWESDLRLQQTEADGLTAEVIFPDTMPPFFPSHSLFASQPRERNDYERRMAGLRAHNRWMRDFCDEVPGRRKAPVQIFLYDIDDALDEIRWGHEAGFPAVLVPAIAPNHTLEDLWSPRYAPIWQLCQELDMAVNQHVGAGTPDIAEDSPARAALLYEVYFYSRRSVWQMIFGGVFDRFPDLKLVMTEEGLAWTVPEMRRLDHYYTNVIERPDLDQSRMGHASVSLLSMRPSDYFRRNCYIGASFMGPAELPARHTIGTEHVMWGADYPHCEGTHPFSREALRGDVRAGLPRRDTRDALGERGSCVQLRSRRACTRRRAGRAHRRRDPHATRCVPGGVEPGRVPGSAPARAWRAVRVHRGVARRLTSPDGVSQLRVARGYRRM